LILTRGPLDWRNAQGGPTLEEVPKISEAGDQKATDEQILEAWEMQKMMAAAGLVEGLKARLNESLDEEQPSRHLAKIRILIRPSGSPQQCVS
jgi:hypothetical protein